MNLRNYLGKQINTSSYGKSEDLPWPYISVPIRIGDGTYECPTYSLFVQLAPGDIIISIERLVNHCAGRFPDDIEKSAEVKLNDLTTGKAHLVCKYPIDADKLNEYLSRRFSRFGLSESILRYDGVSKENTGYSYCLRDNRRVISATFSTDPQTNRIADICVKSTDNKLSLEQAEKIVNCIAYNRVYIS